MIAGGWAGVFTRLRRHGVDLGYALGWSILCRVPERMARAAFRGAADLAWRRDGRGVRRLRANLSRVPGVDPGAADALARQGMRAYARYWLECFRLPRYSRERICDGMHITDRNLLDEAYAAGNGVILALGHLGNWDHAGAWLVHQGVGFTTVAERLEPASLFDRFVAYRASLGMEVLAASGVAAAGEERPPSEVLTERLLAGRCVCLLADRDLSRRGIEVDFLDGRARMAPGPASLALRTGAALLPVTLWFDGADWGARIHSAIALIDGERPAAVAAMTQQLADVFAAAVTQRPADWHMLARFFTDDRGAPPRVR